MKKVWAQAAAMLLPSIPATPTAASGFYGRLKVLVIEGVYRCAIIKY